MQQQQQLSPRTRLEACHHACQDPPLLSRPAASHDESNKLTVEDLRDMIHDSVMEEGEEEQE